MPRLIAFLRGINVGSHMVTMSRLRALFGELDLVDVETFIASGNVIFRSPARTAPLEQKIERHLHKSLGYEVATFIRSEAEVAAVAACKPFSAAKLATAGTLVVGFLRQPVDAAAKRALLTLRTEIDDCQVYGREMYWWRSAGRQSDSKLSYSVFERALDAKATFRNINTVTRLAARYPVKRP